MTLARVGFGDLDERVALAEVDLSDVIAGNPALAGDRTHQVARLYTVASSNGHEETGHSPGGRRSCAPSDGRARATGA